MSGASKQKILKFVENYFVKKHKSLSRIIKHNKHDNCIRRKIVLLIAAAKILE